MGAHNDAVKRLCTGRGNALSLGNRMKALGVKTRHPMPAMLVDGLPMRAAATEGPVTQETETIARLPH